MRERSFCCISEGAEQRIDSDSDCAKFENKPLLSPHFA